MCMLVAFHTAASTHFGVGKPSKTVQQPRTFRTWKPHLAEPKVVARVSCARISQRKHDITEMHETENGHD